MHLLKYDKEQMPLQLSHFDKVLGVMAWNFELINSDVLIKEVGGEESADLFQLLLDSEIIPLLEGMNGDYSYSSEHVDPLCRFSYLLKKFERNDLRLRYAIAVVKLCKSIFDGDWDMESDEFYDDVHHRFDNEEQVSDFIHLLNDCEMFIDAQK